MASRCTKSQKTYNSGYSLVVTHLTTNPPVRCLNRAERTGSLVFNVLWSYVEDLTECGHYIALIMLYNVAEAAQAYSLDVVDPSGIYTGLAVMCEVAMHSCGNTVCFAREG
jgi:hypothetical protein